MAVDALHTPRAYPSECPRTREPRKCSKRSSMRHKAHKNLLQLLGDSLKKLRNAPGLLGRSLGSSHSPPAHLLC